MGTQPQIEPDQNGPQNIDTCIPEWAGEVREVLKGSGAMPLASVARRITSATTNEVAMAVGWLAHAGEISFRRHGGFWEIDLRNPPTGGSQ